jgi:hypothetical protein
LEPLDHASAVPPQAPYYFFDDAMQGMMYGGVSFGDKPDGYTAPVHVEGAGAGVT